MEAKDQAAQLAASIFNRMELEGKCQLHIIEDEIRCRMGIAGGPIATRTPEENMREMSRDLCRLAIKEVGSYGRLSPALQHAISNLYDVLNKEGWRP